MTRTHLLLFLSLFLTVPSMVSSEAWTEYQSRHSHPDLDDSAIKTCFVTGGEITLVKPDDVERGFQCTGTFRLWTPNDAEALDFCESRIPYHITSAVREQDGAQPVTKCTFQINLKCQNGWYQIHNKCYMAFKNQLKTAAEAIAFCKKQQFPDAQLAEFNPILGMYLRDMEFDEVWVSVPDISQYYTDRTDSEAVFVLDATWKYEVKEGTLVIQERDTKHETLCQYTPPMRMAETYILAKLYENMFPMHVHENGITFDTGVYLTLSQPDPKKPEVFDKSEISKKCMEVGKILAVEAWPQTSIEEEFNIIKQFLTEHRFYLTGAYKLDGPSIQGYKDYDDSTQMGSPVFKRKEAGDYSKAHSLSFTSSSRIPTLAAMRGPALCALHTFSYAYGSCKPEANYKMVEYFRQTTKSKICHYVADNRIDISHDEASKRCEQINTFLSGFEEYDEMIAVHAKCVPGDHFWLGGDVPCKSDCNLPPSVKLVAASWDPAVSMNNFFLNNHTHTGFPWSSGSNNRFINFRQDLQAFHTHDSRWTASYICARYAEHVIIDKKLAKNSQ